MTPRACFHHRTKAAVCLAALALAPSAAWSQSVRGSLASEGDQLAQQAGAYSVQPVYLEAEASPVGQADLVQPLYASPQLGAGELDGPVDGADLAGERAGRGRRAARAAFICRFCGA